MKIHLRINNSNERHTRFTTFVNGASCGELTMLTDDFVHFHMILSHGTSPTMDTFRSSGRFYVPADEEVAKR